MYCVCTYMYVCRRLYLLLDSIALSIPCQAQGAEGFGGGLGSGFFGGAGAGAGCSQARCGSKEGADLSREQNSPLCFEEDTLKHIKDPNAAHKGYNPLLHLKPQ